MTIPPRYGRPAQFAPALARIPEQSRPRCIDLHADLSGVCKKFHRFGRRLGRGDPLRRDALRRGRRCAGPDLAKTPIPETSTPEAGGTQARLAEARVAETRV